MGKKIFKTILSTTLVAAITVSGVPVTSVIAQTQTQTEIVMNDSQWNEIQKMALQDGEKVAEEINKYSGDKFDAAVNAALTSYYEEEDFEELENFEDNIDADATEIVEDYKTAAAERAEGTDNGYVPGEVIICFEKGVSEEQIKELIKKEYGTCKQIIEMPETYFAVVDISLGTTVEQAIEDYDDYGIIKVVSEDAVMKTTESVDYSTVVNDKYASAQYYLDTINAKGAWDILSETQHSKVNVAVIDSGVQMDHPDLQNVLTESSYDEMHGMPLSQSSEQYSNYHGTFVSGIIGAESNNGQGIAGVASGYNNDIVKITAYHTGYIQNGQGYMQTSAIINALSRCTNTQVVNMSFGNLLKEGEDYNLASKEAMRQVANTGTILVAAGGNNASSLPHYPSDLDFVISVSATDANNRLSNFSNYGLAKDICAPGSNIYSTDVNGGYRTSNGTSFASPIIAGVVAEMLSVNPDLTKDEITEILIDTSNPVQDTDGIIAAKGGVVDAKAAVKTALEWKNATMPQEVIGMVTSSPADNTVAVVWGQDGERIASGCTYNVYVNGEKKLSRVGCNYYTISDVSAGTATVKVTAILGNKETTGVTQTVTVNGVAYETTTEAIDYTYNVALNKKVTVSNGTTDTAGNLVDGNKTTTWNTTNSVSASPIITIDLEEVKELEYMNIFWPLSSRFGTRRTIDTSIDGVNWENIESINYSPSSSLMTTTKLNKNARFVKITILSTGSSYIISPEISEIEIYGKDIRGNVEPTTEETTTVAPTTEATTTVSEIVNLAADATATASSVEDDSYAASNAIDGDMNTRWSSAFNDGEFITLDLGSICNVGAIKIFWEAAYASKYSIAWSQDGTTWNTAFSANIRSYTEYTTDMFYNRPVRYIRIICEQRATPYGTSIYEIEVNGTKSTVAPQTTEATTTAVETTTAKATGPKPFEVIGQVVSAIGNGSIGVVWGQDAERIASGCKYNVYVDGELKLSEVICNYYVISGLSTGTRTVVIKSVLNGVESDGVTSTVNVY